MKTQTPMIFSGLLRPHYVFFRGFPWFFHNFSMGFHGFSMVFPRFLHGFKASHILTGGDGLGAHAESGSGWSRHGGRHQGAPQWVIKNPMGMS